METKLYHPLSDMGRMKEELLSLFSDTESINKSVNVFYDTPYTPEAMTDITCAVFVETYLTKLEGNRIKEVAVDISVVCDRNTLKLTDEDNAYYQSLGIYGNRIDSVLQAIHSAIVNSDATDSLKKKFCIGNITLLSENPIEKCDTEADFCGKQLHYTYRSFCQFNK